MTGDSIKGTVEVNPATHLRPSGLEVLFLGSSRSSIERITPVARNAGSDKAFHIFLRLLQSDANAAFPQHLTPGDIYKFPFEFVVPESLLPRTCGHAVAEENVRALHAQLPPTLGDHDLMRELDLPDDLSPNNVSIRYGVYARLLKENDQDDEGKPFVLATKARRVRIVPTMTPLVSGVTAVEGVLRRDTTIRNKMFAKIGSIVIESQLPRAFTLPPTYRSSLESVYTSASLAVRFDPVDETSKPPQLSKLVILLKTSTFFASSKRGFLPNKPNIGKDATQAVHIHQIVLSRRCMAGVEWKKRHPLEPHDRMGPAPSKAYKGSLYYLAQILVPITLPSDVTFVPTFHSCLTSRVYDLDMRLTVQDVVVWGRAIELTMPVEMSCLQPNIRRPTYAEAMSQADTSHDSGEDFHADVFPHTRGYNQRHDSVLSYGNFGARLDELPAYAR